jgi:hypothetical protein
MGAYYVETRPGSFIFYSTSIEVAERAAQKHESATGQRVSVVWYDDWQR